MVPSPPTAADTGRCQTSAHGPGNPELRRNERVVTRPTFAPTGPCALIRPARNATTASTAIAGHGVLLSAAPAASAAQIPARPTTIADMRSA